MSLRCRPAAVGAAALTLLTLLTGCGAVPGHHKPPAAPIGTVVDHPSIDDPEGRPVTVSTPRGSYQFTVSSPKTHWDDGYGLHDDWSTDAAKGAAFVEVGWDLEAGSAVDMADAMLRPRKPGRPAEPEFSLVADGKAYSLEPKDPTEADLADTTGDELVVVPDDATDLAVQVVYDGRTLTYPVDQTSRSSGGDLFTDPYSFGWHDLTCPDSGRAWPKSDPRVFGGSQCWVRAVGPLPYTSGTSWAKDGTAYVVVDVTLERNSYFGYRAGDDWVKYDISYREPAFTLDGKRPVAQLRSDGTRVASSPADGIYDRRYLIFSVPDDSNSHTFGFRQPFVGSRKDDVAAAPGQMKWTYKRSLDIS